MDIFLSTAHFQDAITLSIMKKKKEQRIKKTKIVQSSYIIW